LLHKPEGSIDDRLSAAEEQHGKVILQLLMSGWGDVQIAMYLGLDRYTVTRFRKKFSLSRRFRTDGVPVHDERKRTVNMDDLVKFKFNSDDVGEN